MRVSGFYGAASALAFAICICQTADAQTGTNAAGTAPTDQATPTGQPAEPDDASADGTQVSDSESGTIVVTGSRIRRPNLDTFEPTVTVDEQYIEERNLTNLADAINELPGVRGSVTPNGAQGTYGQGVNFVNILGAGSNRTLTLVNGRRFVSSNVPTIFNQGSAGTQVDLNVIPTVLVDRTDIISVGGAPVYGSDAIAGVVNVILKTKFTGTEISVTNRITEEGDGHEYNVSLAHGFNFDDDRGNFTFAYQRDRQDGLTFNARGFLREGYGNLTNPTTAQALAGRPAGVTFLNDGRINTAFGYNNSMADGNPPTVLARDISISSLTYGGLITAATANRALTNTQIGNGMASLGSAVRNFYFDQSGSLIPYTRGTTFVGTNTSGGSPTTFRFADFSQIRSDLKRDIFNAFATYTYSPAFEVFMEGTHFHSRGDELVQQPTFNSSLFAGSSGQLTFDVNSPFLTPQARGQLAALGANVFQVSRASIDLADVTGFSENDLYRGVVGARGEFGALGRTFNYEVTGNYGRTNVTDVRQDLNAQNFVNAVNVTTNAQGQIVCTTTPTRQALTGFTPVADPNCIPLNLLGLGLSDPAARNYVIAENVTKTSLEQWVVNANVGGTLFDLFGNSYGVNVGYEHREERGSFTPSQFEQRGLGRSVGIAPVSGSYNVDEVFGEALLPLITSRNDIPFIHRLEFFARGRYVDNTVNGGFFSWAAGGAFSPIRDIEFRGNFTRSFRAPAISELFLPVSNTFTTVNDLCSPGNRNGGAAPETRARNCAAFLAAFPNSTPLDAASATVPGQSGGNPSLANESADSFTYGILLRPSFLPRMSISIDYINIKIKDPIANLTVAQIASACFDNEEFDLSDPANGNTYCSQIRRYAVGQGGIAANGGDRGGQVVVDALNPGVRSGFVNGNAYEVEGIQGTFDYTVPLADVNLPGTFQMGGDLTYIRKRLVDNTGVAPLQSEGVLGDPEFAAQMNMRYFTDGFGLSVSANYVGEQIFSRVNRTIEFREIDQLNDFVTLNLGTYVDVNDKFRLSFTVTNLLNRQYQEYLNVPIPASYAVTTQGGDLLGRRFAITARGRF